MCLDCTILWLTSLAVAPCSELFCSRATLWTVLQSRHPLNCVTIAASSELFCSRAILSNDDVLPQTPLLDLLRRDFWGTPLAHSGSHGSYRPLAVLSFRFNVLLAGGRVGHRAARGFHVFNTLLHAAATAAFTRWVRALTPHRRRSMTPWVSGLLFAVHPVHVEAVAGIVGKYLQHIEIPILPIPPPLFCLIFLIYFRYCHFPENSHQALPTDVQLNCTSHCFWLGFHVNAKSHSKYLSAFIPN